MIGNDIMWKMVSTIDSATPRADCDDGELRLDGGNNALEGRVEICINEAWGTVCDTAFSSADATVVCRGLGFSGEGMQYLLHCIPALQAQCTNCFLSLC